ncbi:MAG: hypothetical protein KME30_15335 [Iphinoe sp. HA4291-MV1]|jgi:hypothetical protein|nr:hypothetical protein [Iphinoe sp. HA4291-MV1]
MDNIIGIGDIQMADVMKMDSSKALNMFRNRFAAYKKLADEIGEDAAFETIRTYATGTVRSLASST